MKLQRGLRQVSVFGEGWQNTMSTWVNNLFFRSLSTRPRAGKRTPLVLRATAATALGLMGQSSVLHAQTATVTTYHYDTLRTGWNSAETALTPTNVATSAFALQHTAIVDEQVDAQPLFVGSQKIGTSATLHDVVYVATEANTVYAIDAATGTVLLSRNLGTAVAISNLPGGCNNNSANVGIASTPVIDPSAHSLYVIADTFEQGNAVYRLHALDTTTLADKVTPVVIAASQKLSGGSTVSLSPNTSRQRAGLLLANGNIYAGFTSYCDLKANVTRGWVLGWNSSSLKPLAANFVGNGLATSPDTYFLTTIWMSGAGIAADSAGNIVFATGNSDPNGTTYNATLNLAESVVKLTPDLTKVVDYFTPSGATTGVAYMDQHDQDLGAGGVLLLPPQPGTIPSLATAMGKIGTLYLLNETNLGHYSGSSPDRSVTSRAIGRCWCGESYFKGSDNVGRIVTSGGQNVMSWKVQTSPSTTLVQESKSAQFSSEPTTGFFTSVSSNGTTKSTAIVWAVLRPTASSSTVHLLAVDPSTGATLTTQAAGTWPNAHSFANIVPVVANGRVFVSSYKQLAIFGIQGGGQIANAVTVNQPNPLIAATQTITGKETDPSQPVFLDWRTYGTPVAGTSEWVKATVAGDGTFSAQVVIDHAGTQSTMWDYSGDTPVQAAWSATPSTSSAALVSADAVLAATPQLAGFGHRITGLIVSVDGTTVSLRRHDGGTTLVAAGDALRAYLSVLLIVGKAVEARGNYDATGMLHASTILRATESEATWDPDQ